MQKKKGWLLLLTLVLLFGAFSGCKSSKNPNSTTKDVTSDDGNSERLPVPVEQEQHDNKVFTILIPEENELDSYKENPGNRVESSIFRVTESVNKRLGVLIQYKPLTCTWTTRATFNQAIQQQFWVDKSEYDLIMGVHSCTYADSVQNNRVVDLLSLKSVDLGHPWYLKDAVENYSLNGKLYGAIGDASLYTYSEMGVLFFNQETIRSNSMTSPYEYVQDDGKWYAETMFQLALNVSQVNTDNAVDLKTGTFGYLGQATVSRGWLTAFDVHLTEKDQSGNVYFREGMGTLNIDKYDYLYNKFENNPYYLHTARDNDWEDAESCFSGGRSLFYHGFLRNAASFRDVAWDYGIVPMPKYNEQQTEFYTPLGTSCMVMMIMRNADDIELSAKVLELLSYDKYYDSVPEYYEVILKIQYAKDPTCSAMLDIIRENCVFSLEAAYTSFLSPAPYNLFQMDSYWRNDKVHGSASTYYTSNASVWNIQLRRLYNGLK